MNNKNDRHAYLIIAHNEFKVLDILLQLLDDKRNDIYLHIDKKVSVIPPFTHIENAGIHVLSKRYDVHWGDITQIKTEMALYREAYSHGPYQYYHLLSGVDLPIKSQDEIHKFFNTYNGKEFVGFFQGKYHEDDTCRKVSRYYLFMGYNKRNKQTFLPLRILATIIRHTFLKLQDITHIYRKQEINFKKGHNWASLTEKAVKYLLENENFIFKRFKYMQCPDEIYKQSVLFSSPLRHNIYNIENDQLGCMRAIDWNRGEPYCWQDSDWEELKNSKYLFARKIYSSQQQLINNIINHCKKGNNI